MTHVSVCLHLVQKPVSLSSAPTPNASMKGTLAVARSPLSTQQRPMQRQAKELRQPEGMSPLTVSLLVMGTLEGTALLHPKLSSGTRNNTVIFMREA